MAKTKQKIILSALQLFNENGIANVRLQHIADEAFISIGNLAYHYKNKEAIVKASNNASYGSRRDSQRVNIEKKIDNQI